MFILLRKYKGEANQNFYCFLAYIFSQGKKLAKLKKNVKILQNLKIFETLKNFVGLFKCKKNPQETKE